MNDKIIELALESTLLNYVDNETPRRYFICGNADIEEVELFAELIVRECLVIAEQTHETKYGKMSCANDDETVRLIKERFGIE